MSHPHLPAVLEHIDANMDASLDRLFDLLRIPSVSTEAAHRYDCRAAADWLRNEAEALGFVATVVETPENPTGHPMVVAQDPDLRPSDLQNPGARDVATDQASSVGPHVLFYGHYDVQPVDPLDLWDHPPFEPRIETRADGRKIIRARGASDDKGQLMTFVEACRAWRTVAGRPPVKITMLFEGEEEAGSPSMAPFLERHGPALKADVALVCDTGMWDAETPAITTMLRGMKREEMIVRGASRDLHSGMYGSAARNPITLLTAILADLRDADGRIQIPGFYDDALDVDPSVKAIWDGLGFDAARFLGEVGLSIPAGETDRTPLEQLWSRPTAEINGIVGGYTGDGFKTVIPAEARAKLSFRLVGGQDPAAISAAFRAFVQERVPADCSVEFVEHGGAPALSLPLDSPALKAAAAALDEEWSRPTGLIGSGGSIPIVGEFKRRLGMDSLLVGFALEDDNLHSPNEKYDVASFHRGVRSWARILAALAEPQS